MKETERPWTVRLSQQMPLPSSLALAVASLDARDTTIPAFSERLSLGTVRAQRCRKGKLGAAMVMEHRFNQPSLR